jgi:hypothetical protein
MMKTERQDMAELIARVTAERVAMQQQGEEFQRCQLALADMTELADVLLDALDLASAEIRRPGTAHLHGRDIDEILSAVLKRGRKVLGGDE